MPVRFEDNGKGIDSEIRDKVFLPHFSTKKNRLRIRSGNRQARHRASRRTNWFETSLEKGTVFFIELVVG